MQTDEFKKKFMVSPERFREIFSNWDIVKSKLYNRVGSELIFHLNV